MGIFLNELDAHSIEVELQFKAPRAPSFTADLVFSAVIIEKGNTVLVKKSHVVMFLKVQGPTVADVCKSIILTAQGPDSAPVGTVNKDDRAEGTSADEVVIAVLTKTMYC